MVTTQQVSSGDQRRVWLRRGGSAARYVAGSWHQLRLSDVGNAAARETLVTATPQLAAIWTDLFRNMITGGGELRWRENGPGIGRDARIAFSSLLGRYFARAYLEADEGVRVLVPLDTVKRRLSGTSYSVGKFPPSRGLEADWIGLDNNGLVIAEAKGSFNDGVGTWLGPVSVPQVLSTAIAQADRTAVFNGRTGTKLPAKRWAIASRWATEQNGRSPTLLAWDPEEEKLKEDDYRALAKILHDADVYGIMRGLGHAAAFEILGTNEPSHRVAGDVWFSVGGRTLEPGFAAVVWPGGVEALRGGEDVERMLRIRELHSNIAVASLSSHYATNIMSNPLWFERGEDAGAVSKEPERDSRFARRAGLSVTWPDTRDEIAMFED